MTQMTMLEAVQAAVAGEMRRDPRVLMFGEGTATKNPQLVAEFGAARVRNTPLSEAIIAGTAAGAAATGLRPVVDLLFAPFMCYAMDAIVNSAGKLRYMSGGQFSFPMVTLALTGAGWTVGAQHNHNIEARFAHSPGLKVVMPSTASDCKGLVTAALRDDNPVLVFLDIALAYAPGDVADGEHVVPIGKSAVRRKGGDVTLVSYAKSVHACLEAADQLATRGVAADVIDLRSIKPLDEDAIVASVRKTGRLVVVHEASSFLGMASEISAQVTERCFYDLEAPVIRVGGANIPYPPSRMEEEFLPDLDRILDGVDRALAY